MKKKVCAVCGDSSQVNVVLKWKRDRDGKVFDVCLYCAEQGKVNQESVEGYSK
jgi:uncharacterized membrane protein